jgi:ATP-dependent DNA helicase DinG
MARMVEDVLEHEGVALIEAGTGTGKTLAYLVPALLSGRRVVVSTGTRTLQDQIMEHDLPMLERLTGLSVRAACMKGLANYLCRRRYRELLARSESVEPSLVRRLPMLIDWVAETAVGDRAELAALPEDDPLWAAVQSGSETRIGARCSYFDECFVTAMRRRAEQARLIVVNHHLFFADLATRGPHGGGVIPEYDAVIFDEAHQIEDVATVFFGAQVSEARLEKLARELEQAFLAAGLERAGVGGIAGGEAMRLARTLRSATSELFAALPTPRAGSTRAEAAQAGATTPDLARSEASRVELPRDWLGGAGARPYHALDAALEGAQLACERQSDASEAIGQLARRAGQLRDELGRILDAARGDVTYCERRGAQRVLGASPVDISTTFRRGVLERVPAAVLTSATLTTGGSFEFVKQRLGIDFEVDEAALPSPFDYPRQAALYLPALPDPRAAEYVERASAEIVRLVDLTGGGAFVLCTSTRMLGLLAARCRPSIAQSVLVQGEGPKAALLERFRADGHAVLFATLSFWEGVDVPGDALRLVVMDKLPFDVPTDPLVEARCKRLEERGESPFARYLVPSAALTLKQGFGRLIRTARDRGIVAVLDARIRTKGYGAIFLRSLPDATRCDTYEAAREFWLARA